MANYNIPALFAAAFGIGKLAVAIDLGNRQPRGVRTPEGIQVMQVDPERVKSLLGTPIYEQIAFEIVPGVNNNPGEFFPLPDWPLLEVNQAKVIIKTAIAGQDGTVKEFIAMDDFKVVIRGLLVSTEDNTYPMGLVAEVQRLYKLNRALPVLSELLNELGIHNLVIESLQLPSVEGYQNVQPYIMECVSDTPIELRIT